MVAPSVMISTSTMDPLKQQDDDGNVGLPMDDISSKDSSPRTSTAESSTAKDKHTPPIEMYGENLTATENNESDVDDNRKVIHSPCTPDPCIFLSVSKNEGKEQEQREQELSSFRLLPLDEQQQVRSSQPSPQRQSQACLEERVHELETKLATLSLLLQQQRRQPSLRYAVSPTTPPPASPPTTDDDDSDSRDGRRRRTSRAAPALDSPAQTPNLHSRRKRNLSFRLLYQDLEHAKATPTASEEDIAKQRTHNDKQEAIENHRKPDEIEGRNPSDLDVYLPQSSDLLVPTTTTSDGTSSRVATVKDSSIELPMIPPILSNNSIKEVFPESKKKQPQGSEKKENSVSQTVATSTTGSGNNTAKATTPNNDGNNNKNSDKSKWLDYLNSFQESNDDIDRQMEEFVKVPSAVESLLSYGFWICVDSFLYVLTILPIRFVWSCLLLLRYIVCRMYMKEVPDGPYRFHRRHSYQFIQAGIIFIVYKHVLMRISIGKLYHWIRGQSMIKLYVLIAIVEVFDRLMCSLGQDCLDSLYWNTTRRPRSSRHFISIVVVAVYAMVHSFLLFVHVATLNVAMNSVDEALLTLLISGNFAEIKSTVFKKYNKPNLFKITASDICERFKLALFLGLVLILNISQGMDKPMVWSYSRMCGIVWCAEWLADWIKHSFITKFNYISSSVYPEYALLLAGDVTGIGHEGVNLDHSHAVVKRIGLAQIPLVCVMARYLREAIKYALSDPDIPKPQLWMWVLGVAACWLVLLILKLSLRSILNKYSQAKLKAVPALVNPARTSGSPHKKKKD